MPADIVIVGAGAAGIAAARWLLARGHRPLVLEARNRVGGRAWTDTASFGFPVDMGCAWLHSADQNPWTDYAREQGFGILAQPPDWGRRIGMHEPSAQYNADWMAAYERNERLIAAAAAAGRDVAVADLLPNDQFRPRFDAIMGWLMGAYSERVSSVDFARYADTDINWAVREGLGAVVANAATSLEVQLDTPVREIDSRSTTLRLTTDRGVIDARAVIVTVPTNVLAAGGIHFAPALPPAFATALTAVPLGAANKVFFQMEAGALPFEGTTHFLGGDTTRVASYQVRPSGQDVLLAYFGGSLAAELDQRGELESFAREQLSGIFGTGFVRQIVRSVCTAWATDPWSQGAYSAALPGHADSRLTLSEPIRDCIFFAGEACSTDRFGTIYGAWHSGVAAAAKAFAVLPRAG